MPKSLVEELKDEILDLLSQEPLVSAEIAERLRCNYYTARRAMQELEQEGRITKFDRKIRGARWTLGANNGPKTIVPYVRWAGEDKQMYSFGPSTLTEWPKAYSDLAYSVFKVWPLMAQTAARLNAGTPSDILVKRLEARKVELIKARSNLENLLFFINQLLDSPKLWDINTLSQLPDDKDWEGFEPFLNQMLEIINNHQED